MNNILEYILNNAKDISIREFIIIIIFYLTLIANYNNNRFIKTNRNKIFYCVGAMFLTIMLIAFLLNWPIAFIMLAIILSLFIIWMIYNLRMMNILTL